MCLMREFQHRNKNEVFMKVLRRFVSQIADPVDLGGLFPGA